jgi:hypothetical protein
MDRLEAFLLLKLPMRNQAPGIHPSPIRDNRQVPHPSFFTTRFELSSGYLHFFNRRALHYKIF